MNAMAATPLVNLTLVQEFDILYSIAPIRLKESIERIYTFLHFRKKLVSLQYLTKELLEDYFIYRTKSTFSSVSLTQTIKDIKYFIMLYSKIFSHYPKVQMDFSIQRYKLWLQI